MHICKQKGSCFQLESRWALKRYKACLKIMIILISKPTLFRYFGIVNAYFTASLYRDQPWRYYQQIFWVVVLKFSNYKAVHFNSNKDEVTWSPMVSKSINTFCHYIAADATWILIPPNNSSTVWNCIHVW